jgi:hypothetical protein
MHQLRTAPHFAHFAGVTSFSNHNLIGQHGKIVPKNFDKV